MATVLEFPKQRIVRTKVMVEECIAFQNSQATTGVLPEDWEAAMLRIQRGGTLFDRERIMKRIMKRMEKALEERLSSEWGRP